MKVQKKAKDLRVGDRIIGLTKSWLVKDIQISHLTGVIFPLLTLVDDNGDEMKIESGSTDRLQDHIYDVEIPDNDQSKLPFKTVKKPIKKVAKKKK